MFRIAPNLLRLILSLRYGAHAVASAWATRTEDGRRACRRLNDKVLLPQRMRRGEHASYRPHTESRHRVVYLCR